MVKCVAFAYLHIQQILRKINVKLWVWWMYVQCFHFCQLEFALQRQISASLNPSAKCFTNFNSKLLAVGPKSTVMIKILTRAALVCRQLVIIRICFGSLQGTPRCSANMIGFSILSKGHFCSTTYCTKGFWQWVWAVKTIIQKVKQNWLHKSQEIGLISRKTNFTCITLRQSTNLFPTTNGAITIHL